MNATKFPDGSQIGSHHHDLFRGDSTSANGGDDEGHDEEEEEEEEESRGDGRVVPLVVLIPFVVDTVEVVGVGVEMVGVGAGAAAAADFEDNESAGLMRV